MLANFQKTWSTPSSPGLSTKIGEAVKPKGPLKPRVQAAIASLQKQTSKLDGMLSKLEDRDNKIFDKVVKATKEHDGVAARALSNELAEIRKVRKVLGYAKTSLEKIELRLTTAHDLGDTIVTIMPTVGLMKGMKSQLAKFMPEADQEITKMAGMLDGMMTDTFTNDAAFGMETASNEESEKILMQAAAVAETSIDAKLPITPIDSDVTESSTSDTSKFM